MSMRTIKHYPWIWRRIRVWNNLDGGVGIKLCSSRFHSTKSDLKKLRPMILKRIEQRSGFYPVKDIIPIARSVLQARSTVINGVSLLLNHVPVLTCKFCSEVYIGENGHLIRTCFGPKRLHKNKFHQWINGGLNDIIVPVEAFHLDYMFQGVIKHDERFNFDRIPAVVELCWQAGADPEEKSDKNPSFDGDGLTSVAIETLRAWEFMRSGMEKLLLTYTAKVRKHCYSFVDGILVNGTVAMERWALLSWGIWRGQKQMIFEGINYTRTKVHYDSLQAGVDFTSSQLHLSPIMAQRTSTDCWQRPI